MKSKVTIVLCIIVFLLRNTLALRTHHFSNHRAEQTHLQTPQYLLHNKNHLSEQQPEQSNTTEQSNLQSQQPPTTSTTSPPNQTTTSWSNVPTLTSPQLTLNLTTLPRHHPQPHDLINWTQLALEKFQRNLYGNFRLPSSETTKDKAKATSRPPLVKEEHNHQFISNLEANNWVARDYARYQREYLARRNSSYYVRCSMWRPFYNGQECVACEKYFDFDKNHCVQGDNRKQFNPNTHNFVPPVSNYVTDLSAPRLDFNGKTKSQIHQQLLKEARQSNHTHLLCPPQTPYYDGITCINCVEPYAIFDFGSRRCKRCEEHEQYSSKNYGCFEGRDKGDIWTLPKSLSNIFTNV